MTYLILGMARSGQATAHFLTQQGLPFVAYDDTLTHWCGHAVLNNPDTIPWAKISVVIQSPGVPFSLPMAHPVTLMAQSYSIPIQSDIDLFNQNRNPTIPCVGITGTNGKSTTTALITHILNASLSHGPRSVKEKHLVAYMGGNIGTPALSLLEKEDAAYYVLELSSFQLETTQRIDLKAAVLLNITPDHLDRHVSLDAYAAVKETIFKHAEYQIRGESLPEVVTSQNLADYSPLEGAHNVQNINAAIQVCLCLGLKEPEIMAGIKTFCGLSHRMEKVCETLKVLVINDSKATNADATERALASYVGRPIHWILGGVPKEGGIESLKPYFKQIRVAYLIGEAADAFKVSLGAETEVVLCHTLDKAVEAAWQRCVVDEGGQNEYKGIGQDTCQGASHNNSHYNSHCAGEQNFNRPQSILLFSPACASYDQFQNFEHRGDVFRQLVHALADALPG